MKTKKVEGPSFGAYSRVGKNITHIALSPDILTHSSSRRGYCWSNHNTSSTPPAKVYNRQGLGEGGIEKMIPEWN